MKKTLLAPLILAIALICSLLPATASGFSFTATHFTGYVAFDRYGDVVSTYDLDPRLGYEYTGTTFNVAAGLQFDFDYQRTYPTAQDIMNNPTTDWLWTLGIQDLELPGGYGTLPDMEFKHVASYADLLAGANWARGMLDQLPIDGCYYLDYHFTSSTTGTASLIMGAYIDPYFIPECVPDQFFCPFATDARISITTAPIPEPATLLLFGSGLAGLGVWRRRRAR